MPECVGKGYGGRNIAFSTVGQDTEQIDQDRIGLILENQDDMAEILYEILTSLKGVKYAEERTKQMGIFRA
jgi:hypothetical protein